MGNHPSNAGGKLLIIDGGFSKAYQKKDRELRGYTRVCNSRGMRLKIAHEPFESTEAAIIKGGRIFSGIPVVAVDFPAEKAGGVAARSTRRVLLSGKNSWRHYRRPRYKEIKETYLSESGAIRW